jgi:phosphoserine phosphatase RsbU/P
MASVLTGERVASRMTPRLGSSSRPDGVWPWISRFLAMQLFYLTVAVVIYGIFWAIRPESANLAITLLYTLLLCNLTMLALDNLSFLYFERGALYFWLTFLTLLLLLTPLMVTITTAIIFWVLDRPGGSFWSYLGSSWKFPSIATITFGIACQIYLVTKSRLERRNQELQQAVESDLAERELQEQELNRAREIQQALLPKEIPQVEGFDIAATWEPARIVGGDYFDVIRLGEKKLGICIADVVGKSVPAALMMASVQATVRAFALESASPSWLCSRVNSVLCANIAAEKFVTLFYGVLDAEKKTLRYTSAGHPRPILTSATGSVRQLENGGAVLGVFPDWKYEDSTVQLAFGDRLLLFTDGITEATKPDGEQFSEEGLIRLMKRLADEPPSSLNAKLLTEVKTSCNSHLQDDATLIAIAVRAPRTAQKTG